MHYLAIFPPQFNYYEMCMVNILFFVFKELKKMKIFYHKQISTNNNCKLLPEIHNYSL